MRICILGWYGTETIGDRAILAGLISFFKKSFSSFEISLGSLYPFFSKRTILEDSSLFEQFLGKSCRVKLFDSTSTMALRNEIDTSDLVVMGGGPLMDLEPLYMIDYAFKYAKKKNIKRALLGCGIGPLFNMKYQKVVANIVCNSNLTILRDGKSKENINDIFKRFSISYSEDKIFTSLDPAVECSNEYLKLARESHGAADYIAINLRSFPAEYSLKNQKNSLNIELEEFVRSIGLKYNSTLIKLVPMHYFVVGDDDREFLNLLSQKVGLENVKVQNKPLSLAETMEIFKNAKFNIGMRFHSVVLQTILSGKNYVLDYTEPVKGKIAGFIKDIDVNMFYEDRYVCLQETNPDVSIIKNEKNKFNTSTSKVEESMKLYVNMLKESFL